MELFNIFKTGNKIRDKIKEKEYFDLYISEETQRISKYTNKISSNEVKEDRLKSVKSKLFDIKYRLLIAKYSAGYDLNLLKKEMINLLEEWNSEVESSYSDTLNIISIAYLLGITSIDKNNLLKNNKLDWFMHFVIDSKNTDKNEKILYSHYNELKNIVYEDNKMYYIDKYLKNWYNSSKDFWWYDTHKENRMNIYIGYWCFEIAVIVKKLNINDEKFKNNKYYPYDLVHFKESY